MHTRRLIQRTLGLASLIALACIALIPEAQAATAGILQHLGLGGALLAIVAGPGVRLRDLNAQRAKLLDTMAALNAKADFDETTDGPAYAAHKADLDRLNAAITRETDLLAEQARASAGAALGAQVTENIESDPTRGFRSLGDFARTVALSGDDAGMRQRLMAAAPGSTVTNESSGPDGGYAIPPQFSQDIWRLSLGEDSLLPYTANDQITGNSMIYPKDETTPWGGSGIQAYWQNEAAAGTPSKLQLGIETLTLHKLFALVPVTNEMLDDSSGLSSYLSNNAPERITWKANESLLFGDGVGKCLGALNSKAGPLVVQAKDSGQATNTITPTNLSNMVSRLLVGQLKNAIWLANPDVLPFLETMTVGNYPIYLPNNSAAEGSYGMLKGRPLFLSEHASAFSSQGDISLLSLKGYRTITKAGGIQTDTSMHLYFDADATAFRFMFRLNGKPILSAPVQPPKSANTRSHFVTLAAR